MPEMPVSSPHIHTAQSTQRIMLRVILALLPGLLLTSWYLGPGVLVNTGLTVIFALALEALVLKLRHLPMKMYLLDGSAVITALIIAAGLPAGLPWWVLLFGMAAAVLLGKHVFGGLGYNLFNPAMVGYAVILVCFPIQMNQWGVDGVSAATPLEMVKTQLTLMSTMSEMQGHSAFGLLGGRDWEWINLAFMLGGIGLLVMRVINWHTPVAFLSGLFLSASLFYLLDADASSSPLFNLLTGSVMIGAFFVVTDPVTAPTSNRGRLIFGFMVGVLDYLIRSWGRYPDGLAFAVLIMNAATPMIEHYTQPRVLGQGNKRS